MSRREKHTRMADCEPVVEPEVISPTTDPLPGDGGTGDGTGDGFVLPPPDVDLKAANPNYLTIAQLYQWFLHLERMTPDVGAQPIIARMSGRGDLTGYKIEWDRGGPFYLIVSA